MAEILDQIIEVDQGITIDGTDMGKMKGMTIPGKIIEEMTIEVTTSKIIENNGIEVQVGTIIEITLEIIQGKALSKVEIQIEIGAEKDSHDHSLEWNQKVEEIVIDQEESQDLDQVQELVQI